MGVGRQMVLIDSEKLKAEFTVRKLTLEGVSLDIGYGKTYMTNSCTRGKLANNVVQLLQMKYNINPNSYIVKEEPKEVNTSESKVDCNTITKDELYKIIYSAVYEAVKKAWSE